MFMNDFFFIDIIVKKNIFEFVERGKKRIKGV